MSGVASAAYRLALHLYPESFRRRYGDELEADFDDATADAFRTGGVPAMLAVWAAAWGDLPFSILREWLRTPWPLAMLLAGIVAVFALYSSVFRAYGPLQRYRNNVAAAVPRPPDSPELLWMMLLMVLVPVACILLIAGVLTLTMRRRPGPWRRV